VDRRLPLGAVYRGKSRCSFLVWAPDVEKVELRILSPRGRLVGLQKGARGYHFGGLDGVEPDALYVFRLDGLIERPDPASQCQPQGPCGPSRVVDSRFAWKDRNWSGLPLVDYILHEGPDHAVPFDEIAARLDGIQSLGATVLSIRLDAPPPRSSAGFHFAVPLQRGGAPGLKRLVDACHRQGLAVLLRIPLFELGIEGDPFVSFGPYFTGPDRHVNIEGAHSDAVRRYLVESALRWFREFHIDALDVGNIDGLVDPSPTPILEEMARTVRLEAERMARPLHLIARCDRNDPRLIRRWEDGGIGLDALWNPDFSLALQGVLTPGHTPAPPDFGKLEHLKKAFLEGFVSSGEFSASRQRHHGRSSRNLPGDRFLVSLPLPAAPVQKTGEALDELKLAGAALFFSPFVPLLCSGGPETARSEDAHGVDLFHHELVQLRKEFRSAGLLDKQCMGVLGYEKEKVLLVRHWKDDEDLIVLFHFGRKPVTLSLPVPSGAWSLRFDSADDRWNGPGSALPALIQGNGGDIPFSLASLSCAVYRRQHGG
jgi:maltooligosyltrehalose trehalohydrolase